jgi:hypothetical protein
MNRLAVVALVALVTLALIARTTPAGAEDSVPVCLTKPPSGPGSPTIQIDARAEFHGPLFVEIIGRVTVTQAVAPPNGILVYAVSGSAIPNAAGYWVQLTGTGYNAADEVFFTTIAIQLAGNPADNRITLTRHPIGDASALSVFTGVPQIVPCA